MPRKSRKRKFDRHSRRRLHTMSTQPDTPSAQVEHTLSAQVAQALEDTSTLFTATALAEENKVASSTVRTRWFTWIRKVAPEGVLKQNGRYTALAQLLFANYRVEVTSGDKKAAAWVEETKQVYEAVAAEQQPAIEPDDVFPPFAQNNSSSSLVLAPVESLLSVGDAYADLLRNQQGALNLNVSSLIADLGMGTEGVLQQRLEIAALEGQTEATLEFQVKQQAKAVTHYHLQRKEFEGKKAALEEQQQQSA